MSKKESWNIITVFLVLLFGFTLATFLSPKRTRSELENRELAQKPEVSLEAVLDGSFESDYEDYLTDQFIFRDGWVTMKTNLERAIGKKDINGVYLAKDHYLIESHTGTYSEDKAQNNITQLAAFMNTMSQAYDSEHLTAMIVPTAVNILSDKLPAFAPDCGEKEYLGEISDNLPSGTFLDVSEILTQHKEEEIYYRTDHHWKTYGAFLAFQKFAEKADLGPVDSESYSVETVTGDFSGTTAAKVGIDTVKDSIQIYRNDAQDHVELVYNQSDDVRHTLYQDSALSTHDKYGVFFGGNYADIEMKTGASTGRTILVIKDSYANCFLPFLTDRFDEIDIVDLRYFTQSLHEYIQQNAYTDILVLYNASGFAEDSDLSKLNY